MKGGTRTPRPTRQLTMLVRRQFTLSRKRLPLIPLRASAPERAASMDAIYWPSFFFLLFGGLACGFAVAVLLSSNIVRMAFYLVLSLASTSGLFFLAGQDFVGAM